MSVKISNYFKRERSRERAKLMIKMLEFCNESPLSTRTISKLLQVDNKTTRYYLKKFGNLVEKRYNLGFCLSEEGKILARVMRVRLRHKDKKELDKIKKRRNHYHAIFEDWNDVLNKKAEINPSLPFHWYDLPSNFCLGVDKLEFKKLLDFLKKTLNIKSDRKFSLSLGYNEKLILNYRNGKHKPSVQSLRKICDFTNTKYSDLETGRLFIRKFPIKICEKVIQLRTHLINEGNIREDSAIYHNYDPILLKNFQNCVAAINGRIYEPRISRKDIYILTDKFTSQLVQFTNVKAGKTSKANPGLSCLEKLDFELFKRHMQITLAEEGAIHLMLHKKYKNYYVDYYIGLTRAVDVTEDLSALYKDSLSYGFRSFSKLPLKIKLNLIKKRCNLLDDEISYLYRFFNIKNKAFIPKPSGIYKSRMGNISLYWVWSTQNFELINVLQELIFPNSWVDCKAKKFYKTWKKFYSEALLPEAIEEVKEIRRDFNTTGAPNWWIKRNMIKHFPKTHIPNLEKWRN